MSINPLWLVLISLVVAIVPLFLTLGTCYLKVSITLGMLRSALGTQQLPGNVVMLSASLALSIYVMQPVFSECLARLDTQALGSFFKSPSLEAAAKFGPAFEPWREFLKRHAGQREIEVLSRFNTAAAQSSAEAVAPAPVADTDLRTLLAAFVISELKQGFTIGFILLLPFLVVDLVVANILAALGMFMVSPMVIALPIKILFFVLCDGWLLLTRGLLASYLGGGGA